MKLMLGALEVTGITDIRSFDIPFSLIFPDTTIQEINDLGLFSSNAISNGAVHLPIRSWLLRLGSRVVLIDSCVGADKVRKLRPEWHRRTGLEWARNLQRSGLTPDDVDLVMCTHLHADHVGWNTRLENGRWVPTFPNARYVCGRIEYDHHVLEAEREGGDRHGSFADSVLPIFEHGLLDLVDGGTEIAPGMMLDYTPGHTPGHMCVYASHGLGAVFCGDVVHSPIQLANPDLSSAFCSDPIAAARSRRRLLESIAGTGRYLIPAHFPDPGWGQIEAKGNGFQLVSE